MSWQTNIDEMLALAAELRARLEQGRRGGLEVMLPVLLMTRNWREQQTVAKVESAVPASSSRPCRSSGPMGSQDAAWKAN
jgi:hypothetical protein